MLFYACECVSLVRDRHHSFVGCRKIIWKKRYALSAILNLHRYVVLLDDHDKARIETTRMEKLLILVARIRIWNRIEWTTKCVFILRCESFERNSKWNYHRTLLYRCRTIEQCVYDSLPNGILQLNKECSAVSSSSPDDKLSTDRKFVVRIKWFCVPFRNQLSHRGELQRRIQSNVN